MNRRATGRWRSPRGFWARAAGRRASSLSDFPRLTRATLAALPVRPARSSAASESDRTPATWRRVADNLETTIAAADPRQAKAVLRLLIKELRVNARSEILPTYRVVTDAGCALPGSVGRTGIEPAISD